MEAIERPIVVRLPLGRRFVSTVCARDEFEFSARARALVAELGAFGFGWLTTTEPECVNCTAAAMPNAERCADCEAVHRAELDAERALEAP